MTARRIEQLPRAQLQDVPTDLETKVVFVGKRGYHEWTTIGEILCAIHSQQQIAGRAAGAFVIPLVD